jgi:hypothetical protein
VNSLEPTFPSGGRVSRLTKFPRGVGRAAIGVARGPLFLKTPRWLLPVLAAVGSVFGLLEAFDMADMFATANMSLPAVMFASCFGAAVLATRGARVALLSPLTWFLLASAAYFGLGPLLFYYGSPETLNYVQAFYFVTDHSLLRVNLLSAICIFTVVATYHLVRRQRILSGFESGLRVGHVSWQRWLVVYAIVGFTVKYFLYLPYAYGLLAFVPPSSITVYGFLTFPALVLLSRAVFSGARRYAVVLGIVTSLEILAGLLTFSKLEVLLTIVALAIGAHLATRRLRVVASFFGGALVVYYLTIPLVNYGRRQVGISGSAETRSSVVGDYARGEGRVSDEGADSIQVWWSRMCYANAQAFVMDAYDAGQPGTSLENQLVALVPRFLWPSKPIITRGDTLTYLINGSTSSMSSPTSFAEGYWNGGWSMAVAFAAWIGVVFAFADEVCLRRLAAGDMGPLPLACLTVVVGLRPDDWFGPNYLGGFAIIITVHLACIGAALVLRAGRGAERSWSGAPGTHILNG